MWSEEDTFRKLRQTPYNTLILDPMLKRAILDGEFQKFLDIHGWTREEYLNEYHRWRSKMTGSTGPR